MKLDVEAVKEEEKMDTCEQKENLTENNHQFRRIVSKVNSQPYRYMKVKM